MADYAADILAVGHTFKRTGDGYAAYDVRACRTACHNAAIIIQARDGHTLKLYVAHGRVALQLGEKAERGVALRTSVAMIIQPLDDIAAAIIVAGERCAPIAASGRLRTGITRNHLAGLAEVKAGGIGLIIEKAEQERIEIVTVGYDVRIVFSTRAGQVIRRKDNRHIGKLHFGEIHQQAPCQRAPIRQAHHHDIAAIGNFLRGGHMQVITQGAIIALDFCAEGVGDAIGANERHVYRIRSVRHIEMPRLQGKRTYKI